MLVTLNVAAFVVIMFKVCVVTKLVEGAECEWDGATVVASTTWLLIIFPHTAIPTTRKHTTMTNTLLVLLLFRIETPLSHKKRAVGDHCILAWEGNRAFLRYPFDTFI